MYVRKITLLAAAGLLAGTRAAAQESKREQRNEASQSSAQASAQQQSAKTVSGQVTKVSKDELTVESSGGQPMKLKVNDSTQVTVGGQQKSIDELQQGAQVRASYDESGGDRTAKRIEVNEAKSGAAPGGSSPDSSQGGAG